MEGGTTFHFVTDGIQAALERATAAARRPRRADRRRRRDDPAIPAGGPDRRDASRDLAGAARQGEHLFAGIDLPALGYRVQRARAAADTPRMSC